MDRTQISYERAAIFLEDMESIKAKHDFIMENKKLEEEFLKLSCIVLEQLKPYSKKLIKYGSYSIGRDIKEGKTILRPNSFNIWRFKDLKYVASKIKNESKRNDLEYLLNLFEEFKTPELRGSWNCQRYTISFDFTFGTKISISKDGRYLTDVPLELIILMKPSNTEFLDALEKAVDKVYNQVKESCEKNNGVVSKLKEHFAHLLVASKFLEE